MRWSGTDEDKARDWRFFLNTKEAKFLFGAEVQEIIEELLDAGMKVKGFRENKEEYKHDPEYFRIQLDQTNDILLRVFNNLLDRFREACQPYIGFQNSGLINLPPRDANSLSETQGSQAVKY